MSRRRKTIVLVMTAFITLVTSTDMWALIYSWSYPSVN